MTPFRIHALADAAFAPLFDLDDAALAARHARRVVADGQPQFPCRISLEDAAAGDELLLLHHPHHPVNTPYRASGPIYVRRGVLRAAPAPGEVPAMLRSRLLSLRGYDAKGMLRAAEVEPGERIEQVVERMFAMPKIDYLHVHFARPGCYACRVVRA